MFPKDFFNPKNQDWHQIIFILIFLLTLLNNFKVSDLYTLIWIIEINEK